LTHRRSPQSPSSRRFPVARLNRDVDRDRFAPLWWGKESAGQAGGNEGADRHSVRDGAGEWDIAKTSRVSRAKRLITRRAQGDRNRLLFSERSRHQHAGHRDGVGQLLSARCHPRGPDRRCAPCRVARDAREPRRRSSPLGEWHRSTVDLRTCCHPGAPDIVESATHCTTAESLTLRRPLRAAVRTDVRKLSASLSEESRYRRLVGSDPITPHPPSTRQPDSARWGGDRDGWEDPEDHGNLVGVSAATQARERGSCI